MTVNEIKIKIKEIFDKNPNIHVNVTTTRPRLTIRNAPAKITGVYPNLFVVEENSLGYVRRHSLQYADVLIKQVEILEMEEK